MNIGYVYKITSPSGKIYVGSSKDYLKRWKDYKYKRYDKQIKLKNSFIKYGFEKHIFELIWQGSFENMLQKEYEYGILFNVLNKKTGLNLMLPKIGDIYNFIAEETIKKMKNARKGKSAFWNKKILSIYTLQGKYVKTFNSINECSNYLNCEPGQITKVLKEDAKRYKKYQIKYGKNTENIEEYKKSRKPKHDKIIGMYSKNNVLLETFKSVMEIVNKYGYNTCNLYECLNKKRKTTKGYNWKYLE